MELIKREVGGIEFSLRVPENIGQLIIDKITESELSQCKDAERIYVVCDMFNLSIRMMLNNQMFAVVPSLFHSIDTGKINKMIDIIGDSCERMMKDVRYSEEHGFINDDNLRNHGDWTRVKYD